MRKFLHALCVLSLAVSLGGCSNDASATETTSSEEATATETTISEGTSEETTSSEETAEETTSDEVTEGYTEFVVYISNGDHEIPATITLPDGDGPFAGVVMLHGTASSRDEAGNGYKMAAPVLSETYGLATIRIDFMGNGDSTASYLGYTFESAVSDAVAAAEYLGSLDTVDADRIGVMGWSQGGTDALLSAAWHPEVFKSVVTWAGAPDMMLDGFFSEEQYEEAQQNGYFIMTFDWRDPLYVSLAWARDVAETDVLAEFEAGYDGPVLAIAGTEDTTVDPEWSNKIVAASSNEASKTYFIEGMDHTFNVFTEEDFASLYEAVDATGEFFSETLAAE